MTVSTTHRLVPGRLGGRSNSAGDAHHDRRRPAIEDWTMSLEEAVERLEKAFAELDAAKEAVRIAKSEPKHSSEDMAALDAFGFKLWDSHEGRTIYHGDEFDRVIYVGPDHSDENDTEGWRLDGGCARPTLLEALKRACLEAENSIGYALKQARLELAEQESLRAANERRMEKVIELMKNPGFGR